MSTRRKLGFCLNSRVWIEVAMTTPKSCPYAESEFHAPKCEDECGYYELRKPTKYILKKIKILQGMSVV